MIRLRHKKLLLDWLILDNEALYQRLIKSSIAILNRKKWWARLFFRKDWSKTKLRRLLGLLYTSLVVKMENHFMRRSLMSLRLTKLQNYFWKVNRIGKNKSRHYSIKEGIKVQVHSFHYLKEVVPSLDWINPVVPRLD